MSDPKRIESWPFDVEAMQFELDQIECRGYDLAVCLDCQPLLPMPFGSPDEREGWVVSHVLGTGHRVVPKSPPTPAGVVVSPWDVFDLLNAACTSMPAITPSTPAGRLMGAIAEVVNPT